MLLYPVKDRLTSWQITAYEAMHVNIGLLLQIVWSCWWDWAPPMSISFEKMMSLCMYIMSSAGIRTPLRQIKVFALIIESSRLYIIRTRIGPSTGISSNAEDDYESSSRFTLPIGHSSWLNKWHALKRISVGTRALLQQSQLPSV